MDAIAILVSIASAIVTGFSTLAHLCTSYALPVFCSLASIVLLLVSLRIAVLLGRSVNLAANSGS